VSATDWTWTVTTIVAFYAALVGTAALALAIVHERRDRGSVRVRISWGHVSPATIRDRVYLVTGDSPQDRRRQFYVFTLANMGRRELLITEYGLFDSRRHLIETPPPHQSQVPQVILRSLPYQLREGQSVDFIALPDLVKDDIRHLVRRPPRWAYARDATGTFYYGRLPEDIRDDLWGDATYRPWWKFWEQSWWP
jgi:hypothetical protein